MEVYFVVSSAVRGFHVYRTFWKPEQGTVLSTEIETIDLHEIYAVVMKEKGTKAGHLPRKQFHMPFFSEKSWYYSR